MKIIKFIATLFLLNTFYCYSEVGHIDASLERIEIDTNGFYSNITLYKDGQYIGLSGSNETYPNCVAYSSDFGKTWTKVDRIEKPNFTYEYTKYYIDFKDIYFNNTEKLIIFSNFNKFLIYGLNPLKRDEYTLQNELSIENGSSLDYMLSQKIGDEFYVYSRINGISSHNDNSSITIFNPITKSRKVISFDMEKLYELTDARANDYKQSPYYDDQFFTKDKCFFATIANFLDIGEKYPINVRSLIKITDLENPKWEVIPLRFTDSTSQKYIYFDDSLNGYLSTYKTYRQNYPRIYRTSDGGNNWELIYEDNDEQYVLKNMKRANDSTLFALSGYSNIYRSTNNGYNWSRIESESIGGNITDYELIDQNTILVAYDKNTIAKVTIDSKTGIIGKDGNSNIFIKPPYPQPANTEVRIELENTSFVNIKVNDITIFDLDGRKLINQKIKTDNFKSVIWDCSTTPAGIYIINIKHGSEEKSVKVMVK